VCPAANEWWRVVLGFGVIALLATVYRPTTRKLRKYLSKLREAYGSKRFEKLEENLLQMTKLLTGMYQVMGAFHVSFQGVAWPAEFLSIMRAVSFSNLDLFNSPVIACESIGDTYYKRFSWHVGIVSALIAACALPLLYAQLHKLWEAKPEPKPERDHDGVSRVDDEDDWVVSGVLAGKGCFVKANTIWNVLLFLLFLVYPSISSTVILMLRCRTVDARSYLLVDFALDCSTDQYAFYRNVAVLCVMLFPVGIVVFFLFILHTNKKSMPPDWWPHEADTQADEEYSTYHHRTASGQPPPLLRDSWDAQIWRPRMAKFKKMSDRLGFLSGAYTSKCWWFEALMSVHKLAMTTGVVFVSDTATNRILFEMLMSTSLLALVAYAQPFKDRDVLSINSMAQLELLLVLFAAQYLHLNPSADKIGVTLALVSLSLFPIVAVLRLTLKGNSTSSTSSGGHLSSLVGFVKGRLLRGETRSKAPAEVRDAAVFCSDNPMHAGGGGRHDKRGGEQRDAPEDGGIVEMHNNPVQAAQPGAARDTVAVLQVHTGGREVTTL
jgi:hypothetical protein